MSTMATVTCPGLILTSSFRPGGFSLERKPLRSPGLGLSTSGSALPKNRSWIDDRSSSVIWTPKPSIDCSLYEARTPNFCGPELWQPMGTGVARSRRWLRGTLQVSLLRRRHAGQLSGAPLAGAAKFLPTRIWRGFLVVKTLSIHYH